MSKINSVTTNLNTVNYYTNNKSNNVNSDKPYKTHIGLKSGISDVVITVGSGFALTKFIKKMIKNIENSKEINNATPEMSNLRYIIDKLKKCLATVKSMKYFLSASLLTYVGMGYIIDKKINEKYSDLANHKIGLEDKRVRKTKKDNLYYKSNIGMKLGTLIGATSLPVLNILCNLATKKAVNVKSLFSNAFWGAFGGFEFGVFVDFFANKSAKKHADKMAQTATIKA